MYGIALDLGTSGFRTQLIDLETNETLKTVITMGHPLPGEMLWTTWTLQSRQVRMWLMR